MIASESSCRITPISDSCVAGGSAGSVRSHLYELPTNRQSGLLPRRQPDAARSQGNYGGEVCPGLVDESDCRKPSTLDGCW